MPIYEYTCTNCHHSFDLMQKVNEEPAKQCPDCSKDSLVKLVSAAGFQLKGTGWYQTDFKNKENKTSTTKKDNSATAENTTATETSKTSGTTAQATQGDSQ